MAIYYVKNGGGTGSGLDLANAWSYAHYNSIANTNTFPAGSTLLFQKGEVYNGPIVVKSGTSSNPTIYGATGSGANPVINGYTTLSSWTFSSGNIHYASLSFSQVQLVTLDGVLKPMGTYPSNGSYLTYTSHSGNSSITGTAVGALPQAFTGGEVVIKKYRYIIDRHKITSRVGSTLNYSTNNNYGQAGNYEPTDNNGFFIQNHVGTLVKEGDWAYDSATSRLYMHFGTGGPTGRVVKVSNYISLSTLNSTQYVTFNNIDFEGGVAGIVNNATTGVSFNTCNFRKQATGIYLIDTNGMSVQGCTFTDCTNLAIFGEINNNNIIINNSNIQNIGLFQGMGESGDGKLQGIGIDGGNITITNNVVKNIGFNGIAFSGNNILVEHNYVDTFCKYKDDGSGIYTFTNNPYTDGNGVFHNQIMTNRIIRNNLVLNAIGAPQGANWNGDPNGEAAAIYLDGYSNSVTVDGNVCAYGPWSGIMINGNFNHSIINNLAYDYAFAMLFVNTGTSGVGRVATVAMSGNKFIARTSTQKAMQVSMHVSGISPGQMGTWNNNYYARPILDTNPIDWITEYNSTHNFMSVAQWKTFSGQDSASSKSLVTTDADSKLRFDSNNTTSTIVVNLGAIYKDITNTTYTDTETLAPYKGNVLIYNAASTGGGDTTAPTVLSTTPTSGAVNVSIATTVSVAFSEPMLSSSINTTTFTLKQGTTAITGTVSYAGTTATFTPSAALVANTVYTATITTGAKDASNNSLASAYIWTFTTAAASTHGPKIGKGPTGKILKNGSKIITIV